MSEAKTVKEVLIAAKWILENVGWCQGDSKKYASGEGWSRPFVPVAFCSLGSIDAVEKTGHMLGEMAREQLRLTIQSNYIAEWNDNQYRTKEQVVEAFDKAIKRAS